MSNLLADEIEKIQHENFMQAIKGIPPAKRKDLVTPDQRHFLEMLRSKYGWIAEYIDYRQSIEFGLRPEDPLSGCWGEHDGLRRLYRLYGNWYFAQLQLIIAGWDLIKAKAIQEGINFPFANPRAMFARIMQLKAEIDFEPALMPTIGNGQTLKQTRTEWRNEARLLRTYDRTPEVEQYLQFQKDIGWRGFWLYAIWDKRDSRDFEYPKQVWKQFLKAHKEVTAEM